MAKGTPQLVAYVTPPDGAVIKSCQVVSITFIEHIVESTMNSNTVILTNITQPDTPVVVPVEYNYTGMTKTLVLVPGTSLPAGTYQLDIPGGEQGIISNLGLYQTNPYTQTFTVQAETVINEETGEEVQVTSTTTTTESEGLFLLDSYPAKESVRQAGEPVVLVFSEPVDSAQLVGQVTIRPRSLHPLLANISGSEDEIAVNVDEVKIDTTHVLNLATELDPGTEAVLTLSTTLMQGELINIPFQQNWSQMYTTVRDTRLVLGMFGQIFSDMDLSRMIYRESKSTYQAMAVRSVFVADEWADGQSPYAAEQYVLYSTAYKAILNQALESGSGMRQGFALGDFSMTQSESMSREIKTLLDLLKAEVDRWWKLLNGFDDLDVDVFTRRSGSATRSGEIGYPEFLTRVPFDDLGG